MEKNIILINTLPRNDYWDIRKGPSVGMPLGILSIATVLKKSGFRVDIIDPLISEGYLDLIDRKLDNCLFAGISAMTAGVASGLKISEHIKKRRPDIPIVWGGVHPTLFPEQALADDLIDVVVWGEGEETCRDLAFALSREECLSQVKSIAYKDKGKIIQTPRRDFIDINTLPEIDYDLIDIDKYIYRDLGSMGYFGTIGIGAAKIFVINTGRGCPYRCTFCINTHASQKYRPKSLEVLLGEVDHIIERYDPEIIYFQDDLFFAEKKRTLKFFEHYKEKRYRFKWFTLTRINYFHQNYLSNSVLAQIEGACLWLGMGIESGSERIRRLLKKEIDDAQIDSSVELLAQHRIPTNYAFMVGLPFEEDNEVFKTLHLIKRIKRKHPQAEFTYQYYRPYPGGELYQEAIENGYRPPASLRDWITLQDTETGFISFQHLPWIKNRSFINYLLFAVPHSTRITKSNKLGKILEIFLIKLFFRVSLYIRMKFKFTGYLVELKLWNSIRKIRSK